MTHEEALKAVQAQLSLLTAQNGELAARLTLQSMREGTDTELARLAATREKDAALAQQARDKARVGAAFGTAVGLKEALAASSVGGREGSLALARGADGTWLMQARRPMQRALDECVAGVCDRLPAAGRWVVAGAAELESALRCQATVRQLQQLAAQLQGTPASQALPPSLTAVLAGAQTAMLTLGALSDAGKFFRVDRQVQLYEAGDQAQRLAELLFEARSDPAVRTIQRLVAPDDRVVAQAEALRALLLALDAGHRRVTALSTPAADVAAAAAQARLWLDSLDTATRPEAFWALVQGAARAALLAGAGRVELRAAAQAVQVLERRAWRSDRLVAMADAELEFRIVDAAGALVAAGLESCSAAAREVSFDGGAGRLALPD